MTGLEVGAVSMGSGMVKGAATAAGKAVAADSAEKAAILELAKKSPGAEIAGKAMGDRMAAKQLALNKLLTPLFAFVGYRRDYFQNGQFAEDLTERMSDVPEEHIISPTPNVAFRAIEGLSLSLNEPSLKDMYLNLLAAASDVTRATSAHPAYAGIIHQLTSDEAALLPLFLGDRNGIPLAEIRLLGPDAVSGFRVLSRHVVDIHAAQSKLPLEVPSMPLYIDNWTRLGLVEADYQTYRVGDGMYEFVTSRPEYLKHVSAAAEGWVLGFEKGILRITDFGCKFKEAIDR